MPQHALSTDWDGLGPAALLAHLESTHHAFVRAELPRLSSLGRRVAAQEGDRHGELHEVVELYEELRLDLGPHLMKEERVLFPLVRELVQATRRPSFHCGSIANPIAAMVAEHAQTTRLMARLRQATLGYLLGDDASDELHEFYGSLAALDADTRVHIHKENEVLFPAVLALEASLPG